MAPRTRLPDGLASRPRAQANVFGAELLMSEAAVHEAWAAFPDKDELAEHFGVSALAAQSRVLQLRPRGTTGLSPGTQPGGRQGAA